MAADVLTLGPVSFTEFSAPPNFGFGGGHMLHVHKLVGGQRVIQAMGPDDEDLRWSGLLWGDDALETAQLLDALRAAGQPLPLSWGGGVYTVVIGAFQAQVERIPFCVRYQITQVI